MPRFQQPPRNWREIIALAQSEAPKNLAALVPLATITDDEGEYRAYDDFIHRAPATTVRRADRTLLWALVKERRESALRTMFTTTTYPAPLRYYLSDTILGAFSLVDQLGTSTALQGAFPELHGAQRLSIFLEDLTREEAISSSQLEGAATTRLLAQEMLRFERKPKTPGERMILGNLKMMQEALAQKDAPLTNQLIQALHSSGTKGIQDSSYRPGQFRTTDDIAVQTPDGFSVHYPPPAQDLEARLSQISDWYNAPSLRHTHPLLRAMTLHFLIAHEHPFHDGNGRVARALFYWSMFKAGYPVFQYISISRYLKEAPAQYARSFRRVQADELDLTHFFDAQASVITRAFESFYDRLREAHVHLIQMRQDWVKLPEYKALNARQQVILEVALLGVQGFRAVDVASNLQVSNNTSLSDLNKLADAGFLQKEKVGRSWVFVFKNA